MSVLRPAADADEGGCPSAEGIPRHIPDALRYMVRAGCPTAGAGVAINGAWTVTTSRPDGLQREKLAPEAVVDALDSLKAQIQQRPRE